METQRSEVSPDSDKSLKIFINTPNYLSWELNDTSLNNVMKVTRIN